MSHITNTSLYLTHTLFNFALCIVLLRFWMQWVRAGFRNPVGQFVISVTNPAVIPLRKILPSISSLDTATVCLALVIAIGKIAILILLSGGAVAIVSSFLYAVGDVIKFSIYLFFGAIFIQIITSWVNPYSGHPIISLASSLAEPLMAPARKLIPPIGGLDLSPILVFIFLRVSLMLIVAPLQSSF